MTATRLGEEAVRKDVASFCAPVFSLLERSPWSTHHTGKGKGREGLASSTGATGHAWQVCTYLVCWSQAVLHT